ncbi:MAG TPA: beta-galactosidase [Clostridiales bacterium]|nr:beta-galactosidase [Clostridiales bacterium]
MGNFNYSGDKFYLNGEEFTVISGAMHYFRIPREYWRDRLTKLKECGFNTVETYTCWNLHEPVEGQFDFSGMLDLPAYIDIANELGLYCILRPGPYICAEWESGGLPAWLLNYKDMNLRCNDPEFINKVENYYNALLPKITDKLITNGGNIIMMQIENEYGSYGNDHEYMQKIADIYIKHNIDCLLFTSDGACNSMLNGGTLPQYLCVANFGSRPDENFAKLEEFRPNQPRMCGEYWCGWFDHWHDMHHTREPEELAGLFKDMLESGASLNFYMFHGGTNFGFMNGANHYEKFEPTITSYDYNALLSEAGDLTPAYFAVRKVIEEYTGKNLPPLTVKNTEKVAYGTVNLTEYVDVFTAAKQLSEPVKSPVCKFMEDIGQYYGYTLYSSTLFGPSEEHDLNFDAVNDRANIYFDGVRKGYIEKSQHEDNIRIPALEKGQKLQIDILNENMGRVNYGPHIMDRKGIKGVRAGLQYHFGWEIFPLPMDNLSSLNYSKEIDKNVSGFYRATFNIDEQPKDTFINPVGFHKGNIFINGFNLGRYYTDAGPQITLFCPAPMLKSGENEIIVFESDYCDEAIVEFTDTPILDKKHEE